ncbi:MULTISPECIES: hypothetical protein [Amycolatopsis]|uniref:Uncharacterized protein n=1 Tax=Amycolatopsis dendrobii TaxID=2760662 RepID=A0A7W3W2T0_9PSEU|nr:MULTISPECIES: hypothetical protein [Amycolatopsis]MBB1157713.1 hypothetical protein [Amycolatopsis dendrobii]UKD54103.1 hypothetical protein L3Q65_40525 [Amycolatopsis sp. FU40]
MNGEDLQALGLSIGQVRSAAKFHEACAQTSLTELRTIARQSQPAEQERLNDIQFMLRANAASALREAAQWRLLLSPASALSRLSQAGALFQALGQPFGYYLKSMAGSLDKQDPGRISDLMYVMYAELTGEPLDLPEFLGISEIRAHPQQQAYLIVTASSLETRTARQFTQAAARRSPHRSGVIPVGSLGTPIAKYWSVASHLLGGEPDDAFAIARLLHSMCRVYGETMEMARSNEYLWTNASAPVDVADLDISGLTAFSVRRFGPSTMADMFAETGRLDPLARIPLDLGVSLARLNPSDQE